MALQVKGYQWLVDEHTDPGLCPNNPLTLPMLELPSRENGGRARYPGGSESSSQTDPKRARHCGCAPCPHPLDSPLQIVKDWTEASPLAEPEDYPLICSGQGER
jgi:hypothetical protein